MNPLELHAVQLALEGKDVVNSDELVPAAADEPDGLPRILMTELGSDALIQVRWDLPDELKAAVRLALLDVLNGETTS